ncbi:MAG TPA: hypothetical protein VFS00_27735, partial [Polyangiaceae bacterium]|nr:hypothetical protein [Polyangiaceae bacterium]
PAQPPGGPGGPGGKGGRGGGGSGGPSFGIVRVGQVEVTQRQSVINVGRPGAGVEGAPGGEAGPQKEVLPSSPPSMPLP